MYMLMTDAEGYITDILLAVFIVISIVISRVMLIITKHDADDANEIHDEDDHA